MCCGIKTHLKIHYHPQSTTTTSEAKLTIQSIYVCTSFSQEHFMPVALTCRHHRSLLYSGKNTFSANYCHAKMHHSKKITKLHSWQNKMCLTAYKTNNNHKMQNALLVATGNRQIEWTIEGRRAADMAACKWQS